MSLFDTFPSDTGAYRNYGQPVIVTQTDGSTVEGTIRWEDKSGAQVDIPSQDTGAYFSNEFITR